MIKAQPAKRANAAKEALQVIRAAKDRADHKASQVQQDHKATPARQVRVYQPEAVLVRY